MSLSYWSQDDGIDEELCDVALPEGMLNRLQGIVSHSDQSIDSILIDVSPPPGFFSRLLRLSETPRRRLSPQQMALAASVVFAVGLSYLGSLGYFLSFSYEQHPSRVASLDTVLPGPSPMAGGATQLNLATASSLELADGIDPSASRRLVGSVPEITLAPMPSEDPLPSPATPIASLGIGAIDPLSTLLMSSDPIDPQAYGAASRSDEENPELHKMPGLVRRGIEPPSDPTFNLAFLINKRFHPPINLAESPRLRQSRVPLGISPESYRLTQHYLAENELPPPEVVRTEDFLASVDYGFPAARRRTVALHVAGGPSLLSPFPNRTLLQIGVQTGGLEEARREPRHLIVVVDVSRSMQRAGRLENVREALRFLAQQLKKDDRLSLVRFSDKAEVLIEDAGPQHAESIVAAIDVLQPRKGTNVAAGLQAGDRVAADWAWVEGRQQRVVLISDGLDELDGLSASLIEQWTAKSSDRAASLSIIDASINADTGPLPVKPRFVAREAQSANDLRWVLEEELTSQSQVVARNAALTVTFNRKSVAGYRLLGHEATLLAASPKADLHAGETNVAMYEIELLPKGESHVADVRLTWVDPLSRKSVVTTRKITRGHIAKTFAAAPASLQLGALAAETAELLRNSPFRDNYKYESLRRLAEQVSPEGRANAAFDEFSSLIYQAERSRPGRTSRPAWSSTRASPP